MASRLSKSLWQSFTLLLTCLFLQYTLAAGTAHAWNEQTHQRLVEWAYQIIKLTEYEASGAPKLASLTGVTTVSPATPPFACSGQCATQWATFIAKVRTAREQLARMPFGPASKNPAQHDGNITCAPSLTAVALGNYPAPLDGHTPKPGDTNAESCDTQMPTRYEEGGLFDDPQLRAMPNRFLGANLGFLAQAGDARTDDWDPFIDGSAAIVSGLGWLVTLGLATDTNSADFLYDTAQLVKPGATAVGLGFALLLAIVIAAIVAGAQGDNVIDAAFDTVNFVANFDKELFSIVPIEAVSTERTDFVGLGHHINVQPKVTSGVYSIYDWPANQYDDNQGLYYAQAFYNLGGPTNATLFQDSFDHYLIDVSGLGMFIQPSDSYGVSNYQIFDPDDGQAASVGRGFHGGTAYWIQNELPQLTFTPVDNLGYRGWRLFRDNSCKTADALHWPLHALGDAAVPMHVIASTGSGHRPFEEGIERIIGQWEAIRNLSPIESSADDDSEYGVPVDLTARTAAFQKQYDQARSILVRAFAWSQEIQSYQATHPKDIPVRALITHVAQQTLGALQSQAKTLRCDRNACHTTSGTDPNCVPMFKQPCPRVTEIECTGRCYGFNDDVTIAPPVTWDKTPDPTDDPTPCHLSGINPAPHPECSIEARVAEQLSTQTYAGINFPAVLAPSLSDIFASSDDFAWGFYANHVSDHRLFAEIGTAAELAFIVHLAESVGQPTTSDCYCSADMTYCAATSSCVDTSRDRNNCGSCGHVCAPTLECNAGACTASCVGSWQVCNGVCVDTHFESAHCGACGNACPSSAFCNLGGCVTLY